MGPRGALQQAASRLRMAACPWRIRLPQLRVDWEDRAALSRTVLELVEHVAAPMPSPMEPLHAADAADLLARPGKRLLVQELLIERLQAVADGELSRLIVTCPPRLGKSLLVSKLFPAYFIQRHPQLFCAIASYSAELAYAHSREARHYYRLTGNPLSKDSAAVGNWLTPQRGGCIAAGVNGPFTGKGYSLGIIDDPYKGPADASSRVIRERLIDWLRSVWLTRAEPAEVADEAGLIQRNLSAQVIVLTRWDHQDVVAWLLKQELGEAPQHWHVLDLHGDRRADEGSAPFPGHMHGGA